MGVLESLKYGRNPDKHSPTPGPPHPPVYVEQSTNEWIDATETSTQCLYPC